MKRFWKTVTFGDGQIRLDDRPVKTPQRNSLDLPQLKLAEAIAEEWRAQGEEIDPRSMPMTGFANAAIDYISPDPAAFSADLGRYAQADLLCYRADRPKELVARQNEIWNPILHWAEQRYDVHFTLTQGVIHIDQPQETIARLQAAIAARSAFELAALSPIITMSGSLVTALALLEKEIEAPDAFDLIILDDLWQESLWGSDDEALKSRAYNRIDFLNAARFLELIG